MPSPNQYLLGGSDPSPILAPAAPSQPTPWYLDPQQRGAVTSVLSALAAPLTDAYQHAANLAQGRGDYGMELTSGLLAAAGMAAPPAVRGAATAAEELVPAVENAVARGIKAYHGSPYDFERFDPSKIGTGEGAQAYGHGMYFAENEGTARAYKNALSNPNQYTVPMTLDGRPVTSRGTNGWVQVQNDMWDKGDNEGAFLAQMLGDANRYNVATMGALKKLYQQRSGLFPYNNPFGMGDDGINAAFKALRQRADFGPRRGRMYEVNINSDPEHFLDWDKPLSEQSKHVQKALSPEGLGLQAKGPFGQKGYYGWTDEKGRLVGYATTGKPPEKAFNDKELGMSLYRGAGSWSDPVDAAQRLKNAGIPGIKYLDQGSRASGEGTHNYVVFDPATIDIIRKYGIAALMGGGAAAAGAGMTPQPAQAGQGNVTDTIRALQSQ